MHIQMYAHTNKLITYINLCELYASGSVMQMIHKLMSGVLIHLQTTCTIMVVYNRNFMKILYIRLHTNKSSCEIALVA